MTLVRFKLKKANTPARLAHFDARPHWEDLASKIANLFNTPPKDIGVAFIDKAKDAVTLTNDQELQDFYQSFDQSSGEIKFVVQDLQTPDGESAFSRFCLTIPMALVSLSLTSSANVSYSLFDPTTCLAFLITFVTYLFALIPHSSISPSHNRFNLVSGFQFV
jgi:hypothetical protein